MRILTAAVVLLCLAGPWAEARGNWDLDALGRPFNVHWGNPGEPPSMQWTFELVGPSHHGAIALDPDNRPQVTFESSGLYKVLTSPSVAYHAVRHGDGDWQLTTIAEPLPFPPRADSAVDSLGNTHTLVGGSPNNIFNTSYTVATEGGSPVTWAFNVSSLYFGNAQVIIDEDDDLHVLMEMYRDWVPSEQSDFLVYGHGTIVPEPATWVLLLCGGIVVGSG